MHISHIRDEQLDVEASVRETIAIGEHGGLPTQVTHHKAIGKAAWGKTVQTLRLIDEARLRGVDVTLDLYPYPASATNISAALMPTWAQEGSRDDILARLRDPLTRRRIQRETIQIILEGRGGAMPTMSWCLGAIFYFAISEDDIQRVLKHPASMIASDGDVVSFGRANPHPRSYGTFVRVLGRYVRDLKVLTLEDAIRKMTSFPAQRIGLMDRGVLREGMKADLVIFDPKTVRDVATFERPHQYAEGTIAVVINGQIAFEDGTMTTARPGRILYGPARVR
jgi:dihydroorotase/N-acyl-D-amino-acid deacylase